MKVLKAPQSGSQAGTTASHNRFGQYERNRRSPVQPIGNGRRAFIRAAFGASSNAWAGITDSQQAAWTGYAEAHPITDSLGQSVKLTGHMMFVAIGTSLQNLGLPINDDPPVSSTVEPLAAVTLYVDENGSVIIQLASPYGAGSILGGFSRQVSGGVTFMKTFCQLGVMANGQLAYDATAVYDTQFGFPAAGNKVFMRLTPINNSGVTAAPTIVSTRVAPSPTFPNIVLTSTTAGTVTATWTGGASLGFGVFDTSTGATIPDSIGISAPSASPQTISGLNSGDTVYARATDGTNWSLQSNSIVVS